MDYSHVNNRLLRRMAVYKVTLDNAFQLGLELKVQGISHTVFSSFVFAKGEAAEADFCNICPPIRAPKGLSPT